MFRSFLRQPLRSALIAATALTLSATSLSAQQPDDVVARVGDTVITEADIAFAARDLGAELQRFPPAQWRSILTDVLVDMTLLAKEAEKEGLQKDEDFQRQVKFLTTQALRNAYVSQKLEATITEADLKAAYDAELATFKGEEEVRARHILVDTKEAAEKLIKDLDGGADFAELAKANSSDGSAAAGGDLGFFTKGRMVPEFETAAFALEPGKYTKEPVQTQFGWHVLKVDEKRIQPAPAFEDVQDGLRNKLMRDRYTKLMTDLKAANKVEIVKPDVPAADPAKPAQQ
ncbi:peptidylprolyl isomerase [Microvirga tunisiensis]|uniref:Parvulin-like PPIase n=2 Tax=Pannonibacter tanglangensis TaxID=2750084 RepID=A0A7X5JAX2_9HYPH|nr:MULTISPECIES: peptidylprolyl isomerase [unclassified Pannonibacter]NBN66022.1 peptidylprolyl isomerase [Pannonibacter sp. XCT-34]NBN80517.1 peptidylprolyl isomerase [Pannonibacter sp. XCT-53]